MNTYDKQHLRSIGMNEVDLAEATQAVQAKTGKLVISSEKVWLTQAQIAALDGTNEDVVYYTRSMTSYSTGVATTMGLTQDAITVNQFTAPTSLLVSNVGGFIFNKKVACPANPGEILISAYKFTLTPWAYGSELITAGTFATSTGWITGSGWGIVGGVASRTDVSATSNLSFAFPADQGAGVYKVVFTMTLFTSGTLTPIISGSVSASGTARGSAATFTEYLTVTGTATGLVLAASTNFAGTIDNVSVIKRVAQV